MIRSFSFFTGMLLFAIQTFAVRNSFDAEAAITTLSSTICRSDLSNLKPSELENLNHPQNIDLRLAIDKLCLEAVDVLLSYGYTAGGIEKAVDLSVQNTTAKRCCDFSEEAEIKN